MDGNTKQRYISTSIWSDAWFDSLNGKEKLVYFNLLTNSHTNPAGVYQFLLKYVCADTGLSREDVNAAMEKFEADGKAFYYKGYIIIPKWLKHQKIKTGEGTKGDRNGLWLGALKVLKGLPNEIKEFIMDRSHYDFDISKYICTTDEETHPQKTGEAPEVYPPKKGGASQDPPPNSRHDSDSDLDSDSEFIYIHAQSDKTEPSDETDTSIPEKLFLNIWQHTPDVFNPLAKIEAHRDWDRFWAESGFTCEQVQTAMDNFIAAVREGVIRRNFIPSLPDRFVLKSWLTKCQERLLPDKTAPPGCAAASPRPKKML